MINKFSKGFAALTLVAASFGAQAMTVDAFFTFGWGGDRNYSGQIHGVDSNSDGILTTNELTSISENLGNHSLGALFDIGDINIASQTWVPNGIAWQGTADVAFMTFDNRSWSCNTSNGCGITFTSFSAVPEPTSLALLGLGLVGLVARRRSIR